MSSNVDSCPSSDTSTSLDDGDAVVASHDGFFNNGEINATNDNGKNSTGGITEDRGSLDTGSDESPGYDSESDDDDEDEDDEDEDDEDDDDDEGSVEYVEYVHVNWEKKKLLSELKRYSNELTVAPTRYNNSKRITLSVPQHSPVLLHDEDDNKDDTLLLQWKEFADALRKCKFQILRLAVQRIQLPEQVLGLLAPALGESDVKALALHSNDFKGHEGIMFMTEILELNHSLERLHIRSNSITVGECASPTHGTTDLDIFTRFSNAIKNHPKLINLTISSCNIGDNLPVLSAIIEAGKDLKCLDLSENNIDSKGVNLIADVLTSNPSMGALYLNSNQIQDEDAAILAQVLRSNTKLEKLSIHYNPITKIGERALLKAIFDTTSLNTVVESNHICQLDMYIYDNDDDIPTEIKYLNLLGSSFERREKIFHALYGEINPIKKVYAMHENNHGQQCQEEWQWFNIEYFDDVPLELMPNVLELLQNEPSARSDFNARKMIFEVLRNWKMPLLYAFR